MQLGGKTASPSPVATYIKDAEDDESTSNEREVDEGVPFSILYKKNFLFCILYSQDVRNGDEKKGHVI